MKQLTQNQLQTVNGGVVGDVIHINFDLLVGKEVIAVDLIQTGENKVTTKYEGLFTTWYETTIYPIYEYVPTYQTIIANGLV